MKPSADLVGFLFSFVFFFPSSRFFWEASSITSVCLFFLSCFSIVWHELDGLDRWMDVRAFFFMNEMDIGFGFRFGGGIISFVFLRRKK